MLEEEAQSHIEFSGLNLRQDGRAITFEYLKAKLRPARTKSLYRLRYASGCP
jgi:hypothetical protein